MLLAFSGCKPAPEDEVTQVIEKNAACMGKNDVKGYLSTMDEESPSYKVTEEFISGFFEKFQVSTELSDIKVEKISGDTAFCTCKQITKRVKGPEFKDSQSKFIHTLIKRASGWKISQTEVLESNELK